MKISKAQIHEVLQAYYMKKDNVQQKKAKEGSKSDNITLSQEGHLFQEALERLRGEPEIRQEIVAELKARIMKGDYPIEGEKIAPHMVKVLLSFDLE